MKKFGKCNELAWVCGVILISLGVFFVTKGGFGVSMIGAPAYIIHIALEHFFPWYSFGTSEYILQGVLLTLMCLVIQKFDWRFLLSFFTAVIYGYILDFWFFLSGGSAPFTEMPARILSLAGGVIITCFAIALFFRTYLPQQVYELFVVQISKRFRFKMEKVKLIFDLSFLGIALILAAVVSHRFDDVRFTDCIGVGTIVCAVFNAPLIALFGKLLDKVFGFEPKFPKLEQKLKSNQ